MHEIAIKQAVIINARGRERVTNKKDQLLLWALHQQRTMIKHLARIKSKCELVLMPLHRLPILHPFHIFNGIFREARHEVVAGILQHILVLSGSVYWALKLCCCGLDHLRMIIVRMRYKNTIDLFYEPFCNKILHIIKLPLPAAIEQKAVPVVGHDDTAGGKLQNPFRRIHMQAVRH